MYTHTHARHSLELGPHRTPHHPHLQTFINSKLSDNIKDTSHTKSSKLQYI